MRAASGSSALLTRSIADAIASVNKDLALTFRPLSDQIGASLTQERIVAMLAGFFGALALLLAGLGLYGVTSYAVSRRRTEIGIRMALGAAPAGVVRLVLSRVSMLVGLGVLIGAGISLWARNSSRRCCTGSNRAIRDPRRFRRGARHDRRRRRMAPGAPRVPHRSGGSAARQLAQSSVAGRQSSVGSHQSSIAVRAVAVGSRQS